MRSVRPAAALLVAAAVVLGACASDGVPDSQDPHPLVVDLDMDSSDVMALAYAANLPGYDLLAVTVPRTGVVRCPQGAVNARLLLAELGKGNVPVGCGEEAAMAGGHDFPDAWRNPADALYGIGMGERGAVDASGAPANAVALLRDTLRESEERVDLLTLGPLTNVAWALQMEPDLVDRIGRVVMMAGAMDAPGNVVAQPAAGSPEWNAWADPGALAAVIDSGVEVVMVPLDATDDVPVDGRFFGQIATSRATAAADVTYELLARNAFLLNAQQYFWDPLAAAFLENPLVLELDERRVRVGVNGAELGRTLAAGDGQTVRVAIAGSFDEFLATFLAGLRRGSERADPFAPGGPLSVSYDGDQCSVGGSALRSGPLRVAFTNLSESAAAMAIVTLHDGATWQELETFINEYTPGTPNPDFVDILAPQFAAPGSEAIIDIGPGTSGVACYDHVDGVPQRVVLGQPFEVLP